MTFARIYLVCCALALLAAGIGCVTNGDRTGWIFVALSVVAGLVLWATYIKAKP